METASGRVEGRESPLGDEGQVLTFFAVPFAAPPLGPLRLAEPLPHPGWAGVRDCTRPGPRAPQNPGAMEKMAGMGTVRWSEDCLGLNVTTPSLDGEHRPVMVWIHGGGFTTGTGSIPWYDGARFAAHDVVTVTINYRLGPFGFLHLGEHLEDRRESGLAGILDQVRALEWVRDNISAFGGDPHNVTVFGESAGAMSVGTLLGMPGARGLFRRAILQSGAADHTTSPDAAAAVTERFLSLAGVDRAEELLALDPERLLETHDRLAASIGGDSPHPKVSAGMPLLPVRDGTRLPSDPLTGIADGVADGVDVIVGTNLDEWNLFALGSPAGLTEDRLRRRIAKDGSFDPEEMLHTYRSVLPDASPDEIWAAIMTDRVFRDPARRLLEALAARSSGSTRSYLFSWRSSALGGVLGSCHALEIPFVFGTLDRAGVSVFTGPTGRSAEELSGTMNGHWASFAHGEMSRNGVWATYDTASRLTMRFDETSGMESDPLAPLRSLWANTP